MRPRRLQGDYAQLSSEQLIAVNPDVILLADAPTVPPRKASPPAPAGT
jgi:ABC-type hemin transport system substrate-binding protein